MLGLLSLAPDVGHSMFAERRDDGIRLVGDDDDDDDDDDGHRRRSKKEKGLKTASSPSSE